MKKYWFAVLLTALFSCIPANAALHSTDDPVFGPDSVTYDDTSGLEWLDLTKSQNVSYNVMITQFGPGGAYEGWRHATLVEANGLAIHAGIVINIGESISNYLPAARLVGLVGVTAVSGIGTQSLGFVANPGVGNGPGFRQVFSAATRDDVVGHAGLAFEQSDDFGDPALGHYLVRDRSVPGRTFQFEGRLPSGRNFEISYRFDPALGQAQFVGDGNIYTHLFQSATVKVDGVVVPASFDTNSSIIYIQNNLTADQNYDRYQAILQFASTVTAGGVSFDRIFIYAEDPTAAPAFSSVLSNADLIVDQTTLFRFPILQAAFQLGGNASNPRPAIAPVALTYDEAASGDLPSSLPLHKFALEVGVNRVSGSEFIDSAGGFDVESLAFTVPPGAELESIEYEYDFTTEPGALSLGKAVSLWRGTFTQNLANQTMEFLFAQNPSIESHSPVELFGGALPLGPGDYVLGNSGIGHEGGNWPGQRSWNYTVRFVVRKTTPADTTPPVIQPTVLSTFAGLNGWYQGNVELHWSVTDGESAVPYQAGCGSVLVSSDTAGVNSTCRAGSEGGAATQTITLRRDSVRPDVTPMFGPLPNPQGWNNSDVTVSFVGTDPAPGSGIGSCTPNTVLSADGRNQFVSGDCRDIAGNLARSFVGPIHIDKAAPAVVVSAPQEGAAYLRGSSVAADYVCDDVLSGVLSCTGTAASGTPFDTASAGAKSFTVSALDLAGNNTTVVIGYTVSTPAFTLSGNALAFGEQATAAPSAAQSITLTNTGAVALPITGITRTGANANQFSQTNNCSASLAAGGSCTINVVFLPTTAGAKTATLSVAGGAGAGTRTVALSGTGVVAAYTVSPVTLSFGNQARNVASSPLGVTVQNTGSVALAVTTLTRTGTNANQFSQTTTCGASLAAGASCSISVVFLPTSVGAKTATLNVNTGGGAGTKSVTLSGTGIVPVYTLSPATLAFGSQTTTVPSAVGVITLNNTGELPLPVTNVAVTGGNANQFSQSNDCAGVVAAGATCSINVVFLPTSVGSKTTSVAVTVGGGAANQTASVTGTGVAQVYSLDQVAMAFGNQARSVASTPLVVTLTNPGPAALQITSVTRTGANANQFSQINDCGVSVAAGASCTISVVFLPTSEGAKTASLNVNAGGGAGAKSVNLSGTGIVPLYSIAPGSLGFGTQLRNSNSAPLSITLTNTGELALPITSVSFTGANANQFSQTNGCGASLAVGASCTIQVVFRPTSAGPKSANVRVVFGGGAATPALVTLAGTGT